MPFTFSHPLAVIPFRKSRLGFSALIIGSMAPDFLYFIRLAPKGNYGHTLEGLFFFSLPAGLIVFFIYQKWLKNLLIQLFPESHQQKLARFAGDFHIRNSRHFLLITFSVLIGALTHICWDSFTHDHGWAVINLPILQTALVATPIGDFTIYKLLQYSGHLLGMPFLLILYLRWVKDAPEVKDRYIASVTPDRRLPLLVLILGFSSAVGGTYALFRLYPIINLVDLGALITYGVVATLSCMFVLLWILGIRFQQSRLKK